MNYTELKQQMHTFSTIIWFKREKETFSYLLLLKQVMQL